MLSKWTLIVNFLKIHYVWILVTIVASILSNVCTIIIPIAIGKYYQLVFQMHSHRSQLLQWLPLEISHNLNYFFLFFAGLIVAKAIFTFLERYCRGMIGEKFSYQIRNQLFWYQLHLPSMTYDQKGIGRYLLRFSGDLKSIQNYLTNGIIRFISDFLLMLIACIALIYFEWHLGLSIVLVLALTTLLILFLNRSLSIITRERRNKKSNLLSFVNMRLRAISSIMALNRAKPEQQKYEKVSSKVYQTGAKYQKITALLRTIVPTAMYLLLAWVMYIAYYLKQNQQSLDGSILIIFIMLLITLLPIFRRLLSVNITWELGNISFEKLLKILHQAEIAPLHLPDLPAIQGNIHFENVNFTYNTTLPTSDTPINYLLSNKNFYIPSNKITLIHGNSGTGKGTIIKLILGLYPTSTGRILIDRFDLQDYNPKSIRKQITLVSSNFPLLGKTVFEAISYSRKASKRPKAQKILNDLQAHLPDHQHLNLDDKIGDLGTALAKGQQKLLLYARAFLSNKKIILIDEPFQDLDTTSANTIVQKLHQLQSKRTIILFSRKNNFSITALIINHTIKI